MSEDFKSIILEYMDKCDVVLKNNNYEQAKELQYDVINVFEQFIPAIYSTLDQIMVFPSSRKVDYIGNINKLKGKLRILLVTEGKYSLVNQEKDGGMNLNISNNSSVSGSGNSTNTNTNTNTNNLNNTVDIKAELSKVREKIEADEMLDDDAKEEIKGKLDEIETVMDQNPTNNEKWKKLKGVVSWITTKGYKVGEMIMPLITKALFPEAQ